MSTCEISSHEISAGLRSISLPYIQSRADLSGLTTICFLSAAGRETRGTLVLSSTPRGFAV